MSAALIIGSVAVVVFHYCYFCDPALETYNMMSLPQWEYEEDNIRDRPHSPGA